MATQPEFVTVFDANVLIGATIKLGQVGELPKPPFSQPTSLEEASLAAVAAFAYTPTDPYLFGSEILDDVVIRKLTQPSDGKLRPEDRGLGLEFQGAIVAYEAVTSLLDQTGRSWLLDPQLPSRRLPGADYEDSCVWAILLLALDLHPTRTGMVVTNDIAFATQLNVEAETGRAPWVSVSAARYATLLPK